MLNPLARDLDFVLEATPGVWEEFRNRRWFLTGGTGFFGCWLLETFLWANRKLELNAGVTVLTRDPERFARKAPLLAGHPAVRLHRGDVRNFEFPDGGFSHVIHGAADTTVSGNHGEPLKMVDVLAAGTRRTLDFAVERGARKFLLVSTGAVYGEQAGQLLPETCSTAPDPMEPGSAYAEGKRVAELLCSIYRSRHDLETKIARCFAFLGPYLPLDGHFAAGNFIADSLSGGPVRVKGDGSPVRSYQYAADLAAWLWTILARGKACRPYNVGSEEAVTLSQLAALVARESGEGLEVEIEGDSRLGVARSRYVPSTARARSELGLAARVDLAEAVRRTREFARAAALKAAVRLCPICGGDRGERLHQQDFELPEDYPLAGGYEAPACEGCGFVYADTAVEQAAYDLSYRNRSRRQDSGSSTGAGESPSDAARLSEEARRTARFVASEAPRIVDVGCANGGLAAALAATGLPNVAGVDPSPACVAKARARGVEARAGRLAGLRGSGSPVSAVPPAPVSGKPLHPLAADLDHVLAHTSGVWDELRGAGLFVTGGTGFFGCWLLETFAWACDRLHLDASITVLTRSPEAFHQKAPHLAAHRAIRLVRGDVRSFEFPKDRFTHVIHAAAEGNAALYQEQPLLMLDTIVTGARRVLDFAAAAGARRFLFLSSGAIYGPQPPHATHVPETHAGGPDPADPRSAYAEGKRMAELLASIYARSRNIECLIARGFAFSGPYLPLDTHFAIGNFIRDCLAGGAIEIRGDGTPFRSYLYAADLAIWLWTILVRGVSCRPYNVGSERAVTIAGLAEAVARAIAPGTPIRIAAQAQPGVKPRHYVPDTSRGRRELGLAETISLENGIQRTAAWHSSRLPIRAEVR